MTLRAPVVFACLALTAPWAVRAEPVSASARQWWADITALAGDDAQGRLPGTRGYDLAADYVAGRFKALGLKPAGVDGYRQPVALEEQTIDQGGSALALIAKDGATRLLTPGKDVIIAGRSPAPQAVSAPLVFIGYGLHLPRFGHDDFAGVDLKGKIAVVVSGGPADIPGPAKAANRSARAKALAAAGAVGLISLTTPHQMEIPWSRQILLARQPSMYLADADLRDAPDGFFTASVDPDAGEALFAGSGHAFAELCALADASRPLPRFDLMQSVRATVKATRRGLISPNLVAELPGRDPALKGEYVVVSAHLDHLGVGEPIAGDNIYHGAMDDASGVAAVLDIAEQLRSAPEAPRRSVLFLIVTAEEKGLLGSHYFAVRPTVPRDKIIADLNFDMPLPLWPLKTVLAQGDRESTLGADAAAVAEERGLALTPDPLPDRNSFTRTDQFSFVKAGVPALAFKFGFAKGTAEFQIEHDWRANRYHSPADNLSQPGVLKEEAAKLDAYVAALALRVADADARPTWLPDSIFKPKD